jgi:hypothetical protein
VTGAGESHFRFLRSEASLILSVVQPCCGSKLRLVGLSLYRETGGYPCLQLARCHYSCYFSSPWGVVELTGGPVWEWGPHFSTSDVAGFRFKVCSNS